tara:strand:+ start:2272 stop:2823 length:552 start_codon:yes stop_codon:yes gene_type:complete
MSKMKYVKDFDFGEKACNYQCGGPVMAMAKGGGVKEAKTGEMYSSRKAMAKHEKTESPRMQKEEMMKSQTVKNIGPRGGQGMIPPAQKGLGITAPRRQMPVAPREPMIPAMKHGGGVKKNHAMGGTIGKPMKRSTTTEDKMMGKEAEQYRSVTGAGGGSKPIDMYEMAMYKKGGRAMKSKVNC